MTDLEFVEDAGEVRFRALRKLYRRRSNAEPNSLERDAAEYALRLALSRDREANEYLARNAYRNARHTLARRQRSKRAEAKTPFEALGSPSELREHEQSTFEDPLQALLARDLKKRLKRRVAQCHPHAPEVLRSMVRQEPVADVADRLDYSKRTIKRIRKTIREEAQALRQEVMGQ